MSKYDAKWWREQAKPHQVIAHLVAQQLNFAAGEMRKLREVDEVPQARPGFYLTHSLMAEEFVRLVSQLDELSAFVDAGQLRDWVERARGAAGMHRAPERALAVLELLMADSAKRRDEPARRKLINEIGGQGRATMVLDELVHTAKSGEASGINNEGVEAQVRYLTEAGWHVDRLRRELMPAGASAEEAQVSPG